MDRTRRRILPMARRQTDKTTAVRAGSQPNSFGIRIVPGLPGLVMRALPFNAETPRTCVHGIASSARDPGPGLDRDMTGTLGRRPRPSIAPNDVVRRNREVCAACGLCHVGHISVLAPLEHLVLVESAKIGLDHYEPPGQRMVYCGAALNSP